MRIMLCADTTNTLSYIITETGYKRKCTGKKIPMHNYQHSVLVKLVIRCVKTTVFTKVCRKITPNCVGISFTSTLCVQSVLRISH